MNYKRRCWKCMGEMNEYPVCPHCGFNTRTYKAQPHVLEPGVVLKQKYLVGNVIGQGGFGITYVGFDMSLEMKVAIKEYFPSTKATRNNIDGNVMWAHTQGYTYDSQKECEEFLSEARKMAKINLIPEIVSVRDTFEENNTAYIVMDFIPGMEFKDYIVKNGCISFTECVNFLLPLIDGLDKVHRQGLIHRDISPDNLMLTPEGKLYLLDLGAAKDLKDTTGKQTSVSKRGFSPIEQNSTTGKIGPWTDVYSLAATIYYCIYGKVVPSCIERLENDSLTFEKNTKDPLTAKQIAVLKRALAVQPDQRYVSAKAFGDDLRASIEKKPKQKIITALIGIVLVAAIAVGGYFAIDSKFWMPTVEVPMPFFSSGTFLKIPEEYQYFVDLDGSLVRVDFDKKDKKFYIDERNTVYQADDSIDGDEVDGLKATDEFIYFTYFGGVDNSDYLITMDFDGTNQKKLIEFEKYNHTTPRYVKLSDESEYFYYMVDDIEHDEDENVGYHIYRYNMESEEKELVLEQGVDWFTLHGKYLYYTVADYDKGSTELYRTPIGKDKPELLDDTHAYAEGGVIDGELYLFRLKNSSGTSDRGLVAFNEDGKAIEDRDIAYISNIGTDIEVGGGWIYYNKSGTQDLYRIRVDGSGKEEKILEGYDYYNLTYCDEDLYFKEGKIVDGLYFEAERSYFAAFDGSEIIMADERTITSDSGLRYEITKDGKATIVGYEGTQKNVVLPLSIDGYPLDTYEYFNVENYNNLGVTFYALVPESDLEYEAKAKTAYGKTQDDPGIEISGGIVITGYKGTVTGKLKNIAIPATIDGKTVVELGEKSFQKLNFNRVYLPEGMERISDKALFNCVYLNTVILPQSSLKMICNEAFSTTKISGDFVIPDSVISLGTKFLSSTNVDSVKLPSNIQKVGHGFLAGCPGEFVVDESKSDMSVVDGVLFFDNETQLVAFPSGRTGSYVIPDGVTKIFLGAFENSKLSSITVPDSVENIGSYTFYSCENLTTIVLPKGIENIGGYAFYDCNSLTRIEIPDEVEAIGDFAFCACNSLEFVYLNNKLKTIGESAFEYSPLLVVLFYEGVESIGKKAFKDCNLVSVEIPKSVTEIGEDAFLNNGKFDVQMKKGITGASTAFDDDANIIYYEDSEQ